MSSQNMKNPMIDYQSLTQLVRFDKLEVIGAGMILWKLAEWCARQTSHLKIYTR